MSNNKCPWCQAKTLVSLPAKADENHASITFFCGSKFTENGEEIDSCKSFGDLIRFHREFYGDSLSEAAKDLGLTKPHLWELEKGKSANPGVKILNKIRKIYHIPAVVLLDSFEINVSEKT